MADLADDRITIPARARANAAVLIGLANVRIFMGFSSRIRRCLRPIRESSILIGELLFLVSECVKLRGSGGFTSANRAIQPPKGNGRDRSEPGEDCKETAVA